MPALRWPTQDQGRSSRKESQADWRVRAGPSPGRAGRTGCDLGGGRVNGLWVARLGSKVMHMVDQPTIRRNWRRQRVIRTYCHHDIPIADDDERWGRFLLSIEMVESGDWRPCRDCLRRIECHTSYLGAIVDEARARLREAGPLAAAGAVAIFVIWAAGVALVGDNSEPAQLPPPVYVVEQPVAGGQP